MKKLSQMSDTELFNTFARPLGYTPNTAVIEPESFSIRASQDPNRVGDGYARPFKRPTWNQEDEQYNQITDASVPGEDYTVCKSSPGHTAPSPIHLREFKSFFVQHVRFVKANQLKLSDFFDPDWHIDKGEIVTTSQETNQITDTPNPYYMTTSPIYEESFDTDVHSSDLLDPESAVLLAEEINSRRL